MITRITKSHISWKRAFLRVLAGVVALTLAAADATPTAAQAGATKVKLGIIFVGGAAHIYAAQKLGLFQRENLDVDLRSLGGGAHVVPIISSGDLDVGMMNHVSWMLAVQQGYDLVAIGAVSRELKKPPYSSYVYVRDDSLIRTAKDLEGKRIATNTLNNIITLYGNEWLRKHGADPRKVRWTEVPFPQMTDTLINNRVDAAFFVEPFGAIVRGTGKARDLGAPLPEVYPGGMFWSVLAVKREWLSRNEDAARRLVKSVGEAANRLMTDPKVRLELIAEFTKMEPALIQKQQMEDHIIALDTDAVKFSMDLMVKDGLLKEKLPIDRYFWADAPRAN